MSGCEKITPLLSEYVDSRLPAEQREQVDQHLATCAACREDLESLGATVQLLYAMPVMRVPRPFTLAATARRPSILFVSLRAATAAAAVLFALLIGGGLLVREAMAPFAPPPAALQSRAPERAAPSIAGTPAPAPQPLAVPSTQEITAADQATRAPAAPAAAPTTTGPLAPSLAPAPAGAAAGARAPTAPAAQAPPAGVAGEQPPTKATAPTAVPPAPTASPPPPTAQPRAAAAPIAEAPRREPEGAPRPPDPAPTAAPQALQVAPSGPSAADLLRWAQIATAIAVLLLAAATLAVSRRSQKR